MNLNTVDFRRPLRLTIGIVIDATTNISLRSAGAEYLRLDNGRDDMVASKNLTCTSKFQGNTYNTIMVIVIWYLKEMVLNLLD